MSNYKEERPWGTFENLLDAEYCKVNYGREGTNV